MAACDHRAVALVHEAVTLQRNPIERSFEILDTAEQPHPSP